MSSGPGSSSSCRFCAASRIMRLSESAWSTALMERSRLTYSGTIMNGKITMSRSGRTGSVSGILTGSSSFFGSSLTVSSGLLADDFDDGLAAAPVLEAGQQDGEHAAVEARLRLPHVDRRLHRHRADGPALRARHAEEAGDARGPGVAPLAGHGQLALTVRP